MREHLSDIHMARVEFHLEFLSALNLKAETILHLRRELAGAARVTGDEDLTQFLDPGLPDDPYARKLFQKPAPPFVVELPEQDEISLEAGDQFSLPVRFFGNSGDNVSRFARLLQVVGEKGLYKGEGRFELDMIVGRDQAGNQQLLWRSGPLPQSFSVPLVNLRWVLEEHPAGDAGMVLSFRTPARLMSDNKPIFKPCFENIFPFIFRRVTSMLYFWCDVELSDSGVTLEMARDLRADCRALCWQDWRRLDGSDQGIELGGLLGEMKVDDALPDPVWTILRLGELLHIGKGAPYGAGQYEINPGR